MRAGSNGVSRIVLCSILGCMLAACAQCAPLPPTVPSTPSIVSPPPVPTAPLFATYSSKLFGTSFEYPADWQRKPGDVERYRGETGFFQIDGFEYGEGWTIDQVAVLQGFYRINPYINPVRVDSLQIQGQEARLIRPPSDYLGDVVGQAGLLVQLPHVVHDGDKSYNYMLLWAFEDEIDRITQTLRFL